MVSGPPGQLIHSAPAFRFPLSRNCDRILLYIVFRIPLGKSRSRGSPSVEIVIAFPSLEITFPPPLHRRALRIVLMAPLHLKFNVVVVIKTHSFK